MVILSYYSRFEKDKIKILKKMKHYGIFKCIFLKGGYTMNEQKRALVIQDLSCVGRCSLTVALPILSAAAINTGVLPTAVLSTQTDGFTEYTFRDLSCDIEPISKHLETLSLPFSAFYIGYLTSEKQAELVSDLIDRLRNEESYILVDPVFADNGALYSGLTLENVQATKELCKKADLITPNCTEAAFLLGEEYSGHEFSESNLKQKLIRLSSLGAENVVLTGISTEKGKIGAAFYSSETNKFGIFQDNMVKGFFPGGGDAFTSALLAAILNDYSLLQATKFAVSFIKKCIDYTIKNESESRYGLCFEYALSDIIKLSLKE